MIDVYKVSTTYTYCLYLDFDDVINELKMLISDFDNKITIEKIEMTKEEFDNFNEFTGW